MQAIRFAAAIAMGLLTLASAQPHGIGTPDPAYAAAQAQCGNHAAISCCNTQTSNTGLNSGALTGIEANQLAGGNCQQLNVPIVAAQVPFNQACGNNVAACCDTDQNGLIPVGASCIPIILS